MPPVLQGITYLVPAKYFVVLLKGIYLKGVGPRVLVVEGIFLAVFGTVMFILANRKFKKKLV
jgi:ABC-2 type transport system permease protein